MRRVVTFALLILMIIPNKPAQAYTELEVKQVIYSNMMKVTPTVNVPNNQRGVVKYLHNIMISAIWIDFMNTWSEANLQQTEKDYYYSNFVDKINAFNSKFANANDDRFIPIKLSSPGATYNRDTFLKLSTEVTTYIRKILDADVASHGALNGQAKDLFVSDRVSIYSAIYELTSRFEQENNFLKSLKVYDDRVDVYGAPSTELLTIASNSSYSVFMDAGLVELQSNISNNYSITVPDTDDTLSKFTSVSSDGTTKQESINKAYLAVLASSSVYLPFQSNLGSDDFLNALRSLVNNDESVINAYNELGYYKKPVYYRTKDGSGDATRLTVGRLIELVKKDDKAFLVTIDGYYTQASDGSGYVMSTEKPINRVESGDNAGDYQDPNNNTTGNDTQTPDPNATTSAPEPTTTDTAITGGKETPLDDIITRSDRISPTIYDMGTSNQGLTNLVLLKNIFNENNPDIDMDNQSFINQSVYVNPFGDLVLSSNIIVLPGAANASFYANNNSKYIPFTDAFTEYYPSIYIQDSFRVPDPDVKKVVISSNSDDSNFAGAYIKKESKKSSKSNKISENKYKFVMPFRTNVYDVGSSSDLELFSKSDYSLTSWTNWTASGIYRLDTNVISNDSLTTTLYPRAGTKGDELIARNKFITSSFYSMLVLNEDGTEAEVSNGLLDTNKLYNLMINIFNGSSNMNGYEKMAYSEATDENQFNTFENMLFTSANFVTNKFGNAPGLLGLRSMTQDPILGNFFYYIKISLPLMVVLIVIIFLFKFVNKNIGIMFILAQTALSVVIAFIVIYFVPRYLSDITNYFINNSSNELAFKSLQLRQELLIDSTEIKEDYLDFGVFSLSSNSITIYNFTDKQLKQISEDYDLDYLTISSGTSVIIDSTSGLFIQGNKLKINVDRMFDSVKINTINRTSSNIMYYQLELEDVYDTVIEYYTPYRVILDGLVEQVNKLSSIYKLNRATLPYEGSIYKDAFFMDSYVRSVVFINPTDYEKADPDIDYMLLESLLNYFPVGENDSIGLHGSLSTSIKSVDVTNSLWYNTMVQNGYISSEPGEDATYYYNKLINFVNLNTRKFLLSNIDNLGYMADEHILKTTALYATMLFNSEVGTHGNKLYPERLNYEELTVIDTIRPVISRQYSMFTSANKDIVTYTYYEHGFVGLLMLPVIIVCEGATSIVLTYFIYIMYLMLVVFLAIRIFVKSDRMKDTVKGFLKLYSILIVVYLMNVFGFVIASNFDSNLVSILVLMIVSVVSLDLCIGVLVTAVKGIITLDFGANASFKSLLMKNPFTNMKAFKSVTSKLGRMFTRNFEVKPEKDAYDEYYSTDYDMRESYSDMSAFRRGLRNGSINSKDFSKAYSGNQQSPEYFGGRDEDVETVYDGVSPVDYTSDDDSDEEQYSFRVID